MTEPNQFNSLLEQDAGEVVKVEKKAVAGLYWTKEDIDEVFADLFAELEARLEAIDDALDDADAPEATEVHALDNDPIIERIKLWRHAQDEIAAQLADMTTRLRDACIEQSADQQTLSDPTDWLIRFTQRLARGIKVEIVRAHAEGRREIEALFTAGVNQRLTDEEYSSRTECPYPPDSISGHWWTRGYAHQARAFRAVELVAQLAEAHSAKRTALELHRRFHGKVGCPGGADCYVCAYEDIDALKKRERELLEHGDPLSGGDYQEAQDVRAALNTPRQSSNVAAWNAAVEECAKVADRELQDSDAASSAERAASRILTRIRALAKPHEERRGGEAE